MDTSKIKFEDFADTALRPNFTVYLDIEYADDGTRILKKASLSPHGSLDNGIFFQLPNTKVEIKDIYGAANPMLSIKNEDNSVFMVWNFNFILVKYAGKPGGYYFYASKIKEDWKAVCNERKAAGIEFPNADPINLLHFDSYRNEYDEKATN